MFGPRLEQRGDGGDLLAEVERAAARELGLVGAVDAAQLGQAQDLERRAVDDIGRRQGIDPRVVVGVESGTAHSARPVPATVRRASRSAALSTAAGVVVGRLAAASARSFCAHPAYAPGPRASGAEVALRREPDHGASKLPYALLEHAPLLGDEGIEVVGRRPARPSPG